MEAKRYFLPRVLVGLSSHLAYNAQTHRIFIVNVPLTDLGRRTVIAMVRSGWCRLERLCRPRLENICLSGLNAKVIYNIVIIFATSSIFHFEIRVKPLRHEFLTNARCRCDKFCSFRFAMIYAFVRANFLSVTVSIATSKYYLLILHQHRKTRGSLQPC